MTNIERLEIELNQKEYFGNSTNEIYTQILEENNLDPFADYEKVNDRVNMLESVYAILQALANDIDTFRKIETEFSTTSAAYEYLKVRLKDVRNEIDRVKMDTHYADESGNTSSLTSYMYFNRTYNE